MTAVNTGVRQSDARSVFNDTTLNYLEFLNNKQHSIGNCGFDINWMPEMAFDFQKAIIEKAVKKGRMAIFADTGLGKTLIELAIAENIVRETNKRVLILTPLAVAFQFLAEAEKLGIEDIEHTRDGKYTKKIIICNYERLHYLNPADFVAVIADECFEGNTQVEVFENGQRMLKSIKSIKKGDLIYNASGIDRVENIHRRPIKRAVKVTIGKHTITASENHPFFTQRGWVSAIDLKADDRIIKTKSAVYLVSCGILPKMESKCDKSFLREILLSEMADAPTAYQSESSQQGNRQETRRRAAELSCVGMPVGVEGNRPHQTVKSDAECGNSFQSEPDIESDEPQTFRAWRKRDGFDRAAATSAGLATEWMGERVCRVVGKTESGLSDLLQTRLGESRKEVCNRGGWQLPLCEKSVRREERCNDGFVGVDGIEILEQGHPEFEKLKSDDGIVYFYDIGATRHPSYSVEGLLVHNSSILKNFDGKTKQAVTMFLRKMDYRFLATATPSPNDYIELGTSSEALGYLGYMDMLSKFFKNACNTSKISRIVSANDGAKWYLKPHAENDFWKWVSQWSTSIRKPSDLGFDDSNYQLPDLTEQQTVVENTTPLIVNGQASLFNFPAKDFFEIKAESRATIEQRCAKAFELASAHDTSVYWVNLNDEAKLIGVLDKDAVEVKGAMSIEKKEEILLAFSRGEVKKLITKTSITAFGLNWQHCNHTTYFPTYSYEQYYQAIRRFWRFGQKNPVTVDLVLSDGQTRIMESLKAKKNKAEQMFSKLSENVNSIFEIQKREFDKSIIKPSFL